MRGAADREDIPDDPQGGGTLAGTAAFMAPELLDENTFTEKSDVYSYAVVLWEIYDRGIPWRGLVMPQITRKVVDKGERPPVPEGMPSEPRELMVRAWAQDPDARPSFADICKQLQATTPRAASTTGRSRPPAPAPAPGTDYDARRGESTMYDTATDAASRPRTTRPSAARSGSAPASST